jgi:hypothetical protein
LWHETCFIYFKIVEMKGGERMKRLKRLSIVSLSAASLLVFALSGVEAGGKGEGQRLRDGSHQAGANMSQPMNGRGSEQMRGYGNWSGLRPENGTGFGPGDGTRPRPENGTGFGYGKRGR